MFPSLTMNDPPDILFAGSILIRKFKERNLPSFVGISHVHDGLIGKSRHAVALATSNQSCLAGMFGILLHCEPLQVLRAIVQFVAIFVIHKRAVWAWANKRSSNKTMYPVLASYACPIQADLVVSSSTTESWFQESTRVAYSAICWMARWRISPYLTKVRDAVDTFIARNSFPFLSTHTCHYNTGRSM